jgi:hypothetical protein
MSNEEQRYLRNPNFIFRKVVEEMVLIPIHKNVVDMDSIYTLNDLGAFLWEQLEQPHTIEQLKVIVMETYDADAVKVESDLKMFLGEMSEINAVKKV